MAITKKIDGRGPRLEGRPIALNPSPGRAQTALRHVSRIVRLLDHVEKPQLPHAVIEGAEAEMERLRAKLAAAGWPVPGDRAECEAMRAELARVVKG